MSVYNFDGAFANLNQSIAGLGKRIADGRERAEYDLIGKGIADGTIDYNRAAGRLAALGKLDSATEFLKLGETARTRGLSEAATRSLADALGGGSALPPLGEGVPPALGQPAPSLVRSESGGRWDAQNNAVGAGGARGHFGRLQFGQARLQEAAAAGAIPQGTTPQAFMASPEMQQRAEQWHFSDIDRFIAKNGLDRAVGQRVAGITVTVEGMRAVAHLGGKEGLRQFLETGGRYDPSDENGTHLSDYLRQHGGAGSRLAQGDPDIPARGAMPASIESGQPGFAVPGSPAMTGRTFNQIQEGPLDPAFRSEGVSQPWMGSTLQGQPQPRQTASVQPPQRPYDLGADLPAPGAVPAIGQMPLAQSAPSSMSNIDHFGDRQLQVESEQARRGQTPAPGSDIFAATPGAKRAGQVLQAPQNSAAARPAQPSFADRPALGATPAQGQGYSPTGATTQGPAQAGPLLTSEMPRPTTKEQAVEYAATRQMEAARGRLGKLASALANPNLPANARALGELLLKDALEQSKAPDSVKEFTYAKAMGWTTAKSPAEYQREKSKATPAEEIEGRKASAAAAGLKPGDTGYQGYLLTGKMPREDMGPLTATDKKAILEADEGVLAANTAIEALRTAKKLSPQALGGWGAGARASVANNLPDWMVPDGIVGSPQKGEATAELENVVTSQALAQLKSIFGAAPTEGERRILLDIQGSIGQPDAVRQKIYDRGIAMAEKRLGFNQQRADELRGGGFYKPGTGGSTGPRQAAPQGAPQQRQQQPVAAPAQAIEFLRANPGARDQFDAKYGRGASASVLGQ